MAQLDIKFVNVEKSAALEEYAKEHVRNLIRRLDRCPGEGKFIDILFRSESKSPEGALKSAEVLITYRLPGIQSVFHVKKHGADLRSVLDSAIDALENSVQRAMAKKVGARRKNSKFTEQNLETDLDDSSNAESA